jgi:hypothetical protein
MHIYSGRLCDHRMGCMVALRPLPMRREQNEASAAERGEGRHPMPPCAVGGAALLHRSMRSENGEHTNYVLIMRIGI